MDFTPELSSFQGVLVSANNVHNYSKLTSKGGNEEKVKYVIDNIAKFLKNESYINENGIIDTMVSKTRKFAMYIILNADLPVLEEMVAVEGVFLVIWSVPTIPKHLMCEMFWNLHMEEFVCEIITYCYPPLALEVAEGFVENIKYCHPNECLQKLHTLTAACYSLICRLNCFEFKEEQINSMLTAGLSTFHKCLKYFTNPPNIHKLNLCTKDELYKYEGERLQTMLLLIYECFTNFTQEVNSGYFNEIYKSTYGEGCFKNIPPINKVCECQNETILECLNNTNILLLDIFKEIVMGVSVDIFCAWSEFEENGKTMQQNLGELCHKVRTKLLNISSVCEHPVVEMIQQMARKPIIINEIINSTDINVVIQKINSNDEDKASWIHALVYMDQLCRYTELITAVDLNLNMFDEKECLKLYNTFSNHYRNNTLNRDLVCSLSIKVFQCCSVSEKHKLLQEHFTDNQFHDMTDDEEFRNNLTEMFNKFVASSDVDFTEVLNVFLQNPRQVYNQMFILAKDNSQLTNTILKIIELLKDYSNYYYVTETEPCIISIVKNILDYNLETEAQRNNIVKCLCGMKNSEIIPGPKLLLLIIMPNMHKALLNKDTGKIHALIQLLHDAYIINELLAYRAPMLAMLCQVMEVVRWGNISTFASSAPATLQLTIDFQKSLMDTYDEIPEAEGNWLRQRVKKRHTKEMLNSYYYRKLWGDTGLMNLFQSTCGFEAHRDSDRPKTNVWVTQILGIGTQEEWCIVWDELALQLTENEVLRIFQHAVITITNAVEINRTPTTRACLFYCFQNLVYIMRYKFVRHPMSRRQVLITAYVFLNVLGGTNTEDVEEIGARLMPWFAFLAQKKNIEIVDYPSIFKNTHYYALVSRAFHGTNGHSDDNT